MFYHGFILVPFQPTMKPHYVCDIYYDGHRVHCGAATWEREALALLHGQSVVDSILEYHRRFVK